MLGSASWQGSAGDLPLPHGPARHGQRSGAVMTEAEQLLREILEHGDIIGRDAANQTIIQLAVDQPTLDRLMAFGADAAESEDGGDDEPYEGPPMHACWFRTRPQRPTITPDAAA